LTDFYSVTSIAVGYVVVTVTASFIIKTTGVPAVNPYGLKFLYNFSQIFLCAYFSIEALFIAYRNSYSFACNDYDQQDPKCANLMYLFYLSKIWDFWDTIFIVLGKKWKQLSFLHVYHHFSVLLICWLQLNVLYDGDIYLFIMLNAFIHTVMYSYYLICMHTKDPTTGKSLPIWWKSSLTIMQMIQFMTLMVSGIYAYAKQCDGHNQRISTVCVCYTGTLLLLFAFFFVASYGKPKKKKTA
jgi:elongation of very long chain fatty acids protein 4